MYIISKFKDYYDIGKSYGIDKFIIYNRTTYNNIGNPDFLKKIPEDLINLVEKFSGKHYDNLFNNVWLTHRTSTDVEYKLFLLGFCGKLYIGLKTIKKIKNSIYLSIEEISCEFDFEKILEILGKKNKNKNLVEFHSYINHNEFNLNDVFVELNTPIFILDWTGYYKKHYQLEINSKLSEYEFYKVVDPFQAFQKISIFIANVLVNNENNMIEISDENKITQHGYDNWSFRNPDPPKRKQKNNK